MPGAEPKRMLLEQEKRSTSPVPGAEPKTPKVTGKGQHFPPMLGAKPNGTTVVLLAKLASYSLSDDIVDSLIAFLKYNHFETNNLKISPSLV